MSFLMPKTATSPQWMRIAVAYTQQSAMRKNKLMHMAKVDAVEYICWRRDAVIAGDAVDVAHVDSCSSYYPPALFSDEI